MHPRERPSTALLRLAAAQAGALSREQVLGHGLSRHALDRMLAEGVWLRLAAGIASVTSEPRWETQVWAALLVGGDRARVGGEAAGHLAGLIDRAPTEITVWVPGDCRVPGRQPEPPYHWSFRRDRHRVRGVGSVGDPPRLAITDVVLDLAAEAGRDRLIGVVTAAVQRRLVSPAHLLRALGRRNRFPHRALLVDLLDDVGSGAESPLEIRYLRDVERAHGLPVGERQVRRRRTLVDVLYATFRLLVELDGRLGHTGSGRFRDLDRDNLATSDGLATLRYGWSDVDGRPCEVAWQVAHNLRLRGWTGEPTPCPRCRRAFGVIVPDPAA